MIILDANILLYAYQADSPQHRDAADWLNALFAGPETIGLPWLTIWAFLRISTNPRAWPSPMPVATALHHVREWLEQPGVIAVGPGPRHLELLDSVATDGRAVGPLFSDAVLAALAIENGATLASTDRDFSRFSGLNWINPIG